MRACKTCTHWEDTNDKFGNGECRRYPPKDVLLVIGADNLAGRNGGIQRETVVTYTNKDYWCGEYR